MRNKKKDKIIRRYSNKNFYGHVECTVEIEI